MPRLTDDTPIRPRGHWGDAHKPAGRGRLNDRYGADRARPAPVATAAASPRGMVATLDGREGAGFGRTPRQPIREERLRVTAGLRGMPALALSAWRGASGRRYVVGVQDITVAAIKDACEAVFLAVRRDEVGIAKIVHVGFGLAPSEAPAWIAQCTAWGANEMHVHRLTRTEAERVAAVADLTEVAA